jgi:SAM-dependent methyltransferase
MNDRRTATIDYRSRMYQEYNRVTPDQPHAFDRLEVERWGKAYAYYLREWLPENKYATIVDAGCGTGRLLALFKKLGYRMISGVDVSPGQVALSRQIVSNVQETDLLEHLDASQNTFDLIIALDIIEHFRKDEVLRFLELSHRALKPSGRLILQTLNAESPWVGVYRYGDFTHEIAFTPRVLDGLLRLSGFTEVEAREVGPVPLGHSVASSLRYVFWQVIRAGLMACNLAETGYVGSKILTRDLLISARKA